MEYSKEDIVRYVDGEMSAEERVGFEAGLSQDVSLAEDVALYREMKATLSERLATDEGRGALERTLAGMRGRYFAGASGEVSSGTHSFGADAAGSGSSGTGTSGSSTSGTGTSGTGTSGSGTSGTGSSDTASSGSGSSGRVIPMRKWVAGVAAVMILVFSGLLIWGPSKEGGMLESMGKTSMVNSVERGDANDSVMQMAGMYFNKGAFSEAIGFLNKALVIDSTNFEALLYRGIARLHVKEVAEGRKDLERVFGTGSLFTYEAAYYLGLSYVDGKEVEKARVWLSRIPEGAPFREKAESVLKRIR